MLSMAQKRQHVTFVVFSIFSCISVLPLVFCLLLLSTSSRTCNVAAFMYPTTRQRPLAHSLHQNQGSIIAALATSSRLFASSSSDNNEDASVNGQDTTPSQSTSSSSTTSTATKSPLTLADQVRGDFPILQSNLAESGDSAPKPLIYLDSAATSQKPQAVLDAVHDYYTQLNSNVHRGAHTLSRRATAAYEHARDQVAALIHAPHGEEVIFTSGATEALNLVVQAYARHVLESDDEVVLTVAEHHANLVPWQMLQQEIGFAIRYVPLHPETNALDLEQFQALLHPTKTKFVSFQHVSNVLGVEHPVADIVQMIRQTCRDDVRIILDACQSVPHLSVNVQDLNVDFLAASGHKMCAPTGIGFLWGRLDLLNSDQMTPYQGGGEMIDQVTLEGSTFLPSPSKFEAGTPPIAQAVGLGAAIDYLNDIGMDRIAAYEHELGEYLYDQLDQVPGIYILGPRPDQTDLPRAPLCAFSHETIHASDLATFLDLQGVAVRAGHHCCQPLHTQVDLSHSVRASLAFYNTKEEIDAFIGHLRETIRFFDGLQGKERSESEDGNGEEEDDFVPFI